MRWFSAYVAVLLLALFIDPFLMVSPLLPDWFIFLWQVGSIITSGIMALLLLWYLLQQRNQALEQLSQEKALTEALLLNIPRFLYGPAEWLWRSLTYGKPQPIRRPA